MIRRQLLPGFLKNIGEFYFDLEGLQFEGSVPVEQFPIVP